jgi:hypothetical protein
MIEGPGTFLTFYPMAFDHMELILRKFRRRKEGESIC